MATDTPEVSEEVAIVDDVETRELRYFVAVAEELHFGRAAGRLGIAQPPLSRAIQQLERRLGGQLIDRTPGPMGRTIRLTAAGAVLLDEARAALDAVEAAERRTRRALGGHPRLVLASKAGAASEILAKLLDAYAGDPRAIEVEVLLCGVGEQGPLLRTGRADVALLHRPFDSTTGLDAEELLTEGQVAVVPAGHPLAVRRQVTLAELATVDDLPAMRWPGPDGTYPAGPGPEVHDAAQLYQLVALGRAHTILPESARAEAHPGVATIPVSDAPTVTTVIAWPPHSRSLPLAALIETATRL